MCNGGVEELLEAQQTTRCLTTNNTHPNNKSNNSCAPSDLEKERGPVLEEWRMGRTSGGRMQEAHWRLILEGSA